MCIFIIRVKGGKKKREKAGPNTVWRNNMVSPMNDVPFDGKYDAAFSSHIP